MDVLLFALGFVVGSLLGTLLAAILGAAGRGSRWEEKDHDQP